MFVHDHQLRHVLPPEAYFSPGQDHLELERLLYPAWHPVASVAEVPRPGDFVTRRLMDRPLLVRNTGDEVNVYLNVCAHRHCMLTDRPKGNDPHFRCQYHGWEYTAEGRTGKIPDAGSFRPFDRENARLKRYRTARCGDLVFVSLADEGPSLHEFLGEHASRVEESFGEPWRQVWKWEMDYPCNWKIAIENLLESYHIPSLHPKTFGNYPEERNTVHEIHPTWSLFRTDEMSKLLALAIKDSTRNLGLPFTRTYTQWHLYPNLVFIAMDTFRMAKMVVPLTPTTSACHVWIYAPYGPRRGIRAWLSSRINAVFARKGAQRILFEDLGVFASAQRGMEASASRGVIGAREERVWAFQDWIARQCRNASNTAPRSLPTVTTHPCTACDEVPAQ